MSYSPIILEPKYENDVRTILGVDSDEWPDEMINSITIVGVAERKAISMYPSYSSLITEDKISFKLMVLYLIAAQSVLPLKTRLLETEQDNKSSSQRFSKLLETLDPENYLVEVRRFLALLPPLEIDTTTLDVRPGLFAGVKPDIDQISGKSN